MSLGLRQDDTDQSSMGSQLGLIGLCLLLLYIGSVLVAILPPQLLNPGWQLQFVSTLINSSGLGLVGLVLVRLAAYVNPGSGRLRQRRDAFAGWACAAAIGFLLLIPVQGYAAWNGWENANQTRNLQLTTTDRKARDLRQAITSATTIEQLQRNLQAFSARPLPPAALATPLPKLRQQLLDNLERTEGLVKERYERIPPENVWALAQNSLRNMFSALVLSVAFAGLAQRPGVDLSLWHEAQAILRRRQKRTDRQARKGWFPGQRGDSDREYLSSLARKNDENDGKK